jgi:WD40 repeat protein
LQRKIAEMQKRVAEEQSKLAMRNANDAILQRQLAVAARDEAEEQKKEALDQKNKAELLQIRSETSEQRMNRLRLLALSRTLAFQALREHRSSNAELSMLLALHAYQFNMTNGGNTFNPDIYNALALGADNRLVFANHIDGVRCVTVSSDGASVISGSNDKTVRIWNIHNANEDPTVLKSKGDAIRSLVTIPNYILAGDVAGNIIRWSLQNPGAPMMIRAHSSGVNALTVVNNEKLISGGADGFIKVFQLQQLASEPLVLDTISSRITSIVSSPNGRWLAVASEERLVRIYDLQRMYDPPFLLGARDHKIKALDFSNDNELLAGGGLDGTLFVWNLKSRLPFAVLSGHISSINAIKFSPDNTLLATASADRTIRLWDYKNPTQEPILLNGHYGWVWSLAFTPNGTTIVSASEDRTLRLWTVDLDFLRKKACEKVTRGLSVQEWNTYVGENVDYKMPCDN